MGNGIIWICKLSLKISSLSPKSSFIIWQFLQDFFADLNLAKQDHISLFPEFKPFLILCDFAVRSQKAEITPVVPSGFWDVLFWLQKWECFSHVTKSLSTASQWCWATIYLLYVFLQLSIWILLSSLKTIKVKTRTKWFCLLSEIN